LPNNSTSLWDVPFTIDTEAASLATKVGYTLDRPRFRFRGAPVLSGQLPLAEGGALKAKCQIEVGSNWRTKPPKLRCEEPWIRRPGGIKNLDWHIFGDGSLCYVFPEEWADTIYQAELRHGSAVALQVAQQYLIRNARWLLNCHMVAYRQGLAEWPQAWNHWPHGYKEALKAYERGKKHL
jgi:hypothetical protein